VSNNKPFVKSNLLRYKSHNTVSIPKQFIRNNIQQGECLTQSLQIWIWPSTQIILFERKRQSTWINAVTTPFVRSEWILVYYSTSFWRELSNQKYRQKTPETHSLTRYQCHVFKNSRLTPQDKKPRSVRFLETLRAVLINWLIRINSGPNTLRSCFLHWLNNYGSARNLQRWGYLCFKFTVLKRWSIA